MIRLSDDPEMHPGFQLPHDRSLSPPAASPIILSWKSSNPCQRLMQSMAGASGFWPDHTLGRGWKFPEQFGGSNRSADEFASAVRAAQAQFIPCALGAEGALKGANHRPGRIGREVRVAKFAVGAKFQHESVHRSAPGRIDFTSPSERRAGPRAGPRGRSSAQTARAARSSV